MAQFSALTTRPLLHKLLVLSRLQNYMAIVNSFRHANVTYSPLVFAFRYLQIGQKIGEIQKHCPRVALNDFAMIMLTYSGKTEK